MNTRIALLAGLFVLLALSTRSPLRADPIGTAFSYQGVLTDGGQAANGMYDFELELFDNPIISTPLATRTFSNVEVINGRFTLRPDFGDEFFGDQRWIAVHARQSGDPGFTELEPRQEITPAPHAWHAENVGFESVSTPQLADGAVTRIKLAPSSVDANALAIDAVTTSRLADDAVTSAKLASGSVGSLQIADGQIRSQDLGPASVNTSQLADGAVDGDKIDSGAVGSAQLADGDVRNQDLANLAVGTAKLADGAVTAEKLGPASVDTASINDGGVNTADLADGAVTLPKINTGGAGDGDVITFNSGSGQLVWSAAPGGGLTLPFLDTVSHAGPAFSLYNTLAVANASAIRVTADAPGRGLHVTDAGTALRIDNADDLAVSIGSSNGKGININTVAEDGIAILNAGTNGLRIDDAGTPSASIASPASNDGVEVGGAEGHGVWVGHADGDALHVNSASGDGLHVAVVAGDGIHVAASGGLAARLEGDVEISGSVLADSLSIPGLIATSQLNSSGGVTAAGTVIGQNLMSTQGIDSGLHITADNNIVAGGYMEADAFQYDAPQTRYLSIPPTGFSAQTEGQNHLISPAIAISSDSISGQGFVAPVTLPHNAVVQEVRFHITDDSASCDLIAELIRGDFQENTIVMAQATSSEGATPGYVTLTDSTVNGNLINNQAYTYSVHMAAFTCGVEKVHGATIEYTVNSPD